MEQKKLTTRQIITRIIFMIAAIALVAYFFPRSDSFRYEYELGKPWRYGRLSAPYDFPIYRSDSAIQQMEDSLKQNVTPRFILDEEISSKCLSSLNKASEKLSAEAFRHLKQKLTEYYSMGILSVLDREQLDSSPCHEVQVKIGNRSHSIPLDSLKSEKDIYSELVSDPTFGNNYSRAGVRDYIGVCLTADTAAMHHEYARMRQNVSATSGIVLAESRIVDQGEIITPKIYSELESYRREHQLRSANSSDETLMLIGRLLLISLVLGSILLFMWLYRPWLYMSESMTFVAVGSVTIMTILTTLASHLIVNGAYLVPIGIVTIVLSTFHGSRTAYYCHIVMSLLCAFMAPSHFEYFVIQCLVGMVIIFCLKDGLTERSQLMRVTVLAALTYCISYCAYTLSNEGSLHDIPIATIILMICNSLMLLMSYLIIYGLEKTCKFMSGITLVEICNLSKGLLMRLSQEAPGTFQHSMQLGNITANAAREIGANVQLVRTGALYHDIGKLWNPIYYTENQMGTNPHSDLTIEESVQMIKRHVSEGVKLAEKEKLPQEIVDFIVTHHGKGLIKYFYNTWCNEHPSEQPDVAFFSYDGPDPSTKEQSLLMMGDAVEAASKSLKEHDEESIVKLVNSIIDGIVSAGRLNNAKITLKEIQVVKASFIRDLQTIYHTRIAYPELKQKD